MILLVFPLCPWCRSNPTFAPLRSLQVHPDQGIQQCRLRVNPTYRSWNKNCSACEHSPSYAAGHETLVGCHGRAPSAGRYRITGRHRAQGWAGRDCVRHVSQQMRNTCSSLPRNRLLHRVETSHTTLTLREATLSLLA